jgi:UDP-N-acetylmuramoyl-tripeptide--D-alanyl-D-alanine ligase
MPNLSVEEIIEATGGDLLTGNSVDFSGISIDSRTVSGNEIFFAIKGEIFDGHDFLDSALLKAKGAVVETRPDPLPEGKVIIRVEDTLRSLQDLAYFIRMKRNIPVVAITGSNGKTTVKEMIYTVLSTKFRTLKNEGNLNNHIGLPLSLVKLEEEDEMIVLEMGMNHAGEITRLCEIAVPSHGVITNVGSAHIGELGGYKALRAAKLEILGDLGVVIVNADDRGLMEGLSESSFKGQVITFGIESESHVRAANIRTTRNGSSFRLEMGNAGSTAISLKVHGIFNIYNALAAAAVSFPLGVTIDEIKSALEVYGGFPMRFEVTDEEGITVINDSYNANPASMEEAVRELVRMGAGGRVVAALADMKELGDFSEESHREIGRLLPEAGVDIFVAVGGMMEFAAGESERSGKMSGVFRFSDSEEAGKEIHNILRKGDTVLIKGSRSMAMEKIIRSIRNVI